jgi:aspartyl/glutamyl-tRNA(Asn/Gln) amidotransferase C subunit
MSQVTNEEIQKLADMARIHVTAEEGEKLAESFDSIIAYVDQIRGLETDDAGAVSSAPYNQYRNDSTEAGSTYSRDIILEDMPLREEDYLKVKKIL